ncbi:hypothetical protein B0T18DRAFT_393923 [Schizothecium vesticola]|uniref:Uncharacterized protein n=1 Tax=Schizothecium vesticola TaxID=314040 RepID=A0AA40K0F8_9PEZI|nr:hypothetical protein B0T18DRAFT_393923 [Schizothecium vesticola]
MRCFLAVALAILGLAQAAPVFFSPPGLPRFAAERARHGHQDSAPTGPGGFRLHNPSPAQDDHTPDDASDSDSNSDSDSSPVDISWIPAPSHNTLTSPPPPIEAHTPHDHPSGHPYGIPPRCPAGYSCQPCATTGKGHCFEDARRCPPAQACEAIGRPQRPVLVEGGLVVPVGEDVVEALRGGRVPGRERAGEVIGGHVEEEGYAAVPVEGGTTGYGQHGGHHHGGQKYGYDGVESGSDEDSDSDSDDDFDYDSYDDEDNEERKRKREFDVGWGQRGDGYASGNDWHASGGGEDGYGSGSYSDGYASGGDSDGLSNDGYPSDSTGDAYGDNEYPFGNDGHVSDDSYGPPTNNSPYTPDSSNLDAPSSAEHAPTPTSDHEPAVCGSDGTCKEATPSACEHGSDGTCDKTSASTCEHGPDDGACGYHGEDSDSDSDSNSDSDSDDESGHHWRQHKPHFKSQHAESKTQPQPVHPQPVQPAQAKHHGWERRDGKGLTKQSVPSAMPSFVVRGEAGRILLLPVSTHKLSEVDYVNQAEAQYEGSSQR